MSRRLPLAAAALLAIGLLPLRAGAVSCPSYFFKSDLSKCHADGFCGRFDLEASTVHDGVVEEDDPPPEGATLPDPWAAPANATIGSGDFFAIADSGLDAGRSRVAAGGDVRAEAPLDFPTFEAVGRGQALALARVTDLVFSGPGAEVETSLQLVFDGALTEQASNIVEEVLQSSMLARTTVYLGGGICQGGAEYVDFLGYHLRTLLDNSEGAATLVASDHFLLDQVPLEGATPITVGPFTVPTGEPLQLEFWVETVLITSGNGGFARAAAEFSLALGPIGGGPVFDLPPGYTANSPTAGIVANQVPEPGCSGAAGALAVGLLAWRSRSACCTRRCRRETCATPPVQSPRGRLSVRARAENAPAGAIAVGVRSSGVPSIRARRAAATSPAPSS